MKSDTKRNTIKALLDNSTTRLPTTTLEKLRSARTKALDHQRIRRTVPALVWLGHHGGGRNDLFRSAKAMNWAVALLFLVFLVSGISAWQNYSNERDICETDIAILTGDLPINVYLN